MPQISLPIIDALFHPPLGVLTEVAWPGNPYSGPYINAAPTINPAFQDYGVKLRINSVAPGHGHDVSFPVEYRPPLGKMCVIFVDFSGFSIVQQIEPWTYDGQVYLWETPLPTLFSLYLHPDATVNLFWMRS
jgi:hypothetical protein